MKTKSHTFTTLTWQRDADFYSACCRRLANPAESYESTRALVKATLHQPAPQFYLTHSSALRRLRDMRRRGYSPTYRSKQQMWADLDERVAAVEQRHGISLSAALMRVLSDFKAPRFYISPSAGERIFRTQRIIHRRRFLKKSVGNSPNFTNFYTKQL